MLHLFSVKAGNKLQERRGRRDGKRASMHKLLISLLFLNSSSISYREDIRGMPSLSCEIVKQVLWAQAAPNRMHHTHHGILLLLYVQRNYTAWSITTQKYEDRPDVHMIFNGMRKKQYTWKITHYRIIDFLTCS